MDANSDPSFKAATSPSTCWKELRQAVGNSVWDGFFTPDGNFLDQSDQGLEQPVTTNKVRGPQSAQAKKIGNHAYYLIDHIFYSPGSFGHHDHAKQPAFRSCVSPIMTRAHSRVLEGGDDRGGGRHRSSWKRTVGDLAGLKGETKNCRSAT